MAVDWSIWDQWVKQPCTSNNTGDQCWIYRVLYWGLAKGEANIVVKQGITQPTDKEAWTPSGRVRRKGDEGPGNHLLTHKVCYFKRRTWFTRSGITSKFFCLFEWQDQWVKQPYTSNNTGDQWVEFTVFEANIVVQQGITQPTDKEAWTPSGRVRQTTEEGPYSHLVRGSVCDAKSDNLLLKYHQLAVS